MPSARSVFAIVSSVNVVGELSEEPDAILQLFRIGNAIEQLIEVVDSNQLPCETSPRSLRLVRNIAGGNLWQKPVGKSKSISNARGWKGLNFGFAEKTIPHRVI